MNVAGWIAAAVLLGACSGAFAGRAASGGSATRPGALVRAVREQLARGEYAAARDGLKQLLVDAGGRQNGDARARIALAGAHASEKLGEAAAASRWMAFALKQRGMSAPTRARVIAAARRLATARDGAPQSAPAPAASDAPAASSAPGAASAMAPAPVAAAVTLPPPPPEAEIARDAGGSARFTRITPDAQAAHGALQAAVAVYRRAAGGPEVMLCGMVHVGFPSFYAAVNDELKFQDAILDEGVRGHAEAEQSWYSPLHQGRQWRDRPGRGVEIAAGSEPLTHQNLKADPALPYVPCDLSYGELEDVEFSRFGTRTAVKYLVRGNLFDQLPGQVGPDADLREWARGLETDARPSSLLRRMAAAARELVDPPPPPEVHDYLVLAVRNAHVIHALEGYLARPRHYRVAVKYGAAHMPEMDAWLEAQGYRRAEVRWHTVWSY